MFSLGASVLAPSEMVSFMRCRRSAASLSARPRLSGGMRLLSSSTAHCATASTSLVSNQPSAMCRILAPVAPYVPLDRLKLARELRFVHQRRALHARAQRAAQRRERRRIARLVDREIDVA